MPDKRYTVNEIFCSLQGEGVRAGTLNHFLRFSGCNLQCAIEAGPLSPGGFDCDTEFVSGRRMTAAEILAEFKTLNPLCKNVILTGGEPLLQVDRELVACLNGAGFHIAIETNGSKQLPQGVAFGLAEADAGMAWIDWITCSPKVAEHAVRLARASEVKYVRGFGQGIPRPVCKADHMLISPAFDGLELDRRAMDWCVKLIRDNPTWRLSVQSHKAWAVR